MEEPFRYFEELAGRVSFPVIYLLRDFKESGVFPTCFVDNPHWTQAGSAVAARAVYQHCLRLGCFEDERGL